MIDPNETPEQAANRELKEEIGYGAKTLVPLKSVTMAPQFFAATMHIFVARALYDESLPGDEPEPLEQVRWSIDDAEELLKQHDFTEARSIAALLMTLRELKQ